MTVLDNVDRIPAPDVETFEREYLRTGTPVVLTGLFDHVPIARLRDPAVARSELADLDLPVRTNVVEEFLTHADAAVASSLSFGEFYDDLRAGRRSRDFCVEHSTPSAIAAQLPPPPYVEVNEPGDWGSNMFFAGPGNMAHLHYDGDQRDVLMYQVFGRKRYVTIDVSETAKLAPGPRPTVRRSSGIFLENFTDDDMESFLRYTNAWDCVLEPGEAVLIPSGTWHYVEYVDVALSVNFRLGRNRYIRALMEAVPVTSPELVALCACMRDEDAVAPAVQAAFDAIIATAARTDLTADERVVVLDQMCLSLCRELELPIARDPYDITDIVRRARMADGSELGSASTAPAVTSSRPFRPDDVVALVDSSELFVPVTGGGIVLARAGEIDATLPPDPQHPWTLSVLMRVARQPGLSVAELAEGAQADVAAVGAFLSSLSSSGWVNGPVGPNP
jgi:hypothetical protein